jgi:adenosylcobyric acid synthase
MVQGTASSVGKSVLVTALCRIFYQDGYRVAPFKAQNMSNNSFVTADGGEIGRAQAAQAEACGIPPEVVMNPVLLKPSADHTSQVIVLGKPVATLHAREYFGGRRRQELLPVIAEALNDLRRRFDIVVIEGAGSPVEMNLKDRDIVNMAVAKLARAPVLLVGDIDRGGVMAALVGTLELLEPDERELVAGLVINRFRGDVALFQSGVEFLQRRTGKPVLGIIPYFHDIYVSDEDAVALERPEVHAGAGTTTAVDIAIIHLPRIANFDEFAPLGREPGVRVRYIDRAAAFGRPDLVIIPGTKATIADLAWLRASGLAGLIVEHARRGGHVAGICGGYQMLGRCITDPEGAESPQPEAAGLGLLDVETAFAGEKVLYQVEGEVAASSGPFTGLTGCAVEGYEIHHGRSRAAGPPLLHLRRRGGRPVAEPDGTCSADGRIWGSYLHGLFENAAFRHRYLAALRGELPPEPAVQEERPGEPERRFRRQQYDRLADLVRRSLDIPRIYRIIGL